MGKNGGHYLTGHAEQMAKLELLEHYAEKSPCAFLQYDVFSDCDGDGDSVVRPDEDGDCLFCGSITFELMSGGPTVRVLVTLGATAEQVLRALKKVRQCVKRDGLEVDDDWLARKENGLEKAIQCPRCGYRPNGRHDELCRYPDGTPTALTDDEVRRALEVLRRRVGHLPAEEELPF